MGKKAPKAPDLGPMAQASMESARLADATAREQLAWSKEQMTRNEALMRETTRPQMEIQQEQLKNARADRARYESMYLPLEENLVKEFQGYDTPERRAQERGRAMADVGTQMDASRRNALSRLESYGVDPSQTRNAALDLGTRVQEAAMKAGAASQAGRQTEAMGRSLRAEAINIGKGMPSNVAAAYGQSLGAGGQALQGALSTSGMGGQLFGGANQYMGTAQQGFGNSANIMSQGYQNQMQQHNANSQMMTGALSAMGGMAGMMADGGDIDEMGFDSEPGVIDYGEGDGSGIDDQVPIQASTGEYIIPADVVRIKGEEFFDKLVERYHTPAEEQREDPYVDQVRSGRAMNPSPPPNAADGGYQGRRTSALPVRNAGPPTRRRPPPTYQPDTARMPMRVPL
jgi:hypothetical protein